MCNLLCLCFNFMSVSNQTVHNRTVFRTHLCLESLFLFTTINNTSLFSTLMSSSSQYFDRKVKQPRAHEPRVWIQTKFLFSHITHTIVITFSEQKYFTKDEKLTRVGTHLKVIQLRMRRRSRLNKKTYLPCGIVLRSVSGFNKRQSQKKIKTH